MHASVSNKSSFCYALLYCCLVWLLPALSYADTFGVEVKNAEIATQGNSYVLSADMDYRLSARAKEALQNGVPLYWDIHIKTCNIAVIYGIKHWSIPVSVTEFNIMPC